MLAPIFMPSIRCFESMDLSKSAVFAPICTPAIRSIEAILSRSRWSLVVKSAARS